MKRTNNYIIRSWLFFLLLLPVTIYAQEQFRVAKVFGDNMVLQRNANVAVWGWDNVDQEIILKIGNTTTQSVAGEDGKWMARLPSFKAGGPYAMEIEGSSSITFENILFGDVWLASGQSNMEWSLGSGVVNGEKEISSADYPEIRQIKIPNEVGYRPREDISRGEWRVCSSETVRGFSAVAYFFARHLYQKYEIPIGIINSSWGGTGAEAWTSGDMLRTLPDFRGRVLNDEANPENWDELVAMNIANDRLKWDIISNSKTGIDKGVHKRNYNDSKWDIINVPDWDKSLEDVIYLRKTITIPKNMKGKDMLLHAGQLDQRDETYFNGIKIGGSQDPNLRVYPIDGNLVRSGKNTIAIRLVHPWNNHPRMTGPEESLLIKQKDGDWQLGIVGAWKFMEGLEPDIPDIIRFQDSLSSLYNAMINPLIPYTLTGTIWYQGEHNAGRAYQYRDLFKSMITDWRIGWDAGYFPFLFVQLANWRKQATEPGPSDWAELREAQLMALDLQNTGMAVTIDVGEEVDIHPRNKQDVGKRLALAARNMVYGDATLVYSGPVYKNMRIEGDKIILSFDQIGSGLLCKGSELHGFEIAGIDKKFYWAKAKIVEDEIEVWSDKVKTPVAVRYAWANNPDCNLYNFENLPATPFRTDDWPGITFNRK
ncbi:sialate O-acetylesterase [Bacteroidota bacterium]